MDHDYDSCHHASGDVTPCAYGRMRLSLLAPELRVDRGISVALRHARSRRSAGRAGRAWRRVSSLTPICGPGPDGQQPQQVAVPPLDLAPPVTLTEARRHGAASAMAWIGYVHS
jgi:hypothetical protein